MPVISRFYGILITMLFKEKGHNTPHFHAKYGDDKAVYSIAPFKRLEGKLRSRAEKMVKEWAKAHQKELLEDWERASQHKPLKDIDPLD